MPFTQVNREKDYIGGLQIGEHLAARQEGVGVQETVGGREQHGEPERVRRAYHDGPNTKRNDRSNASPWTRHDRHLVLTRSTPCRFAALGMMASSPSPSPINVHPRLRRCSHCREAFTGSHHCSQCSWICRDLLRRPVILAAPTNRCGAGRSTSAVRSQFVQRRAAERAHMWSSCPPW